MRHNTAHAPERRARQHCAHDADANNASKVRGARLAARHAVWDACARQRNFDALGDAQLSSPEHLPIASSQNCHFAIRHACCVQVLYLVDNERRLLTVQAELMPLHALRCRCLVSARALQRLVLQGARVDVGFQNVIADLRVAC